MVVWKSKRVWLTYTVTQTPTRKTCPITNLVPCHDLLPPEPSGAVTRLERVPGRVPQSTITLDMATWGKVLREKPVGTERMTEVVDLALKTWSNNNLRSTKTIWRWVPALTPGEVAYLPTVVLRGLAPGEVGRGRRRLGMTPGEVAYLPTVVLLRGLAPREVCRRRRRLGISLPSSKGWGEISPLSSRPDRKLKRQITTNVDRCINRSPYTIIFPTSCKSPLSTICIRPPSKITFDLALLPTPD